MAEDHNPISSQRISPYDVSRASFSVVRRGFEPREVRNFLDLVSRELEAWEAREAELRHQLALAEDQAQHPVIDESTLTSTLGEKSAQVLREAHEQARALLDQAQQDAAQIVSSAQERASALAVAAEERGAGRIGDAEIAATNLEAQALDAAKKVVAKARADGETLVARAREQGRDMLDQAQEARSRVLADMNARRRLMHLQIEQLRAARDQLASSIVGVRSTIDRLTEEITASDETARAAAQEVARRQPTSLDQEDPSVDDVLDVGGSLEADEASRDEATTVIGATGPEQDEANLEPGRVEELFAKIRASAHDPEAAPVAGEATEAASGPDAGLLATRDGALAAASSTLARKVKRALQDEQNRLLDALRGQRQPSLEPLSDLSELLATLAAASVDPLRDAADAGRLFGVDHGSPDGPGLSDGAVMAIAQELAGHVAEPLHRRISGVLGAEDPANDVNAAFREWRGSRLERVVSDAAHEAFNAAVVTVAGDGDLRWVPSGTPTPCPDCADNGLEGPLKAGSTFPTGHAAPPAHAGCRCAVVPAST
jgi:DivIVA domain-containing protein